MEKEYESQIESLLKKVGQMQSEIQKLKDIRTIENIMNKMWYLFEAGMYEERLDYMATKTPGVSVEIGARGVFEGENIRKSMVDIEIAFQKSHTDGMKKGYPDISFESERAGMLESTLQGSPVIEIAEDGQSAKGVWVALMVVGKSFFNIEGPVSKWCWWKSAADFVKEDGEWKILHLQQNPLFITEYDKSWVETCKAMPPLPTPNVWKEPSHNKLVNSPMPDPDRPTTELYNSYRVTTVPKLIPKPPEPYKTLDDTFKYN